MAKVVKKTKTAKDSSSSKKASKVKSKKKLPSLPEELEDTKKVGPNCRVRVDTIGDAEYLVAFVKLTGVKGTTAQSGRAIILGKTERFAKLDGDVALNMIVTKKVVKDKKRGKRDDDDE